MAERLEFKLPEQLTIAQAHSLHDELEALLENKDADELLLHADSVIRADTAGLQLLLAVVEASKERQLGISWDQPSIKLIEAATVLGIESALGLH